MSWIDVISVGTLCGIGFTMSIFVTNLSFDSTEAAGLVSLARLSILCTSIIAAVVGLLVLGVTLKNNPDNNGNSPKDKKEQAKGEEKTPVQA